MNDIDLRMQFLLKLIKNLNTILKWLTSIQILVFFGYPFLGHMHLHCKTKQGVYTLFESKLKTIPFLVAHTYFARIWESVFQFRLGRLLSYSLSVPDKLSSADNIADIQV